MKNCKNCRHWDNDPDEDFGECLQSPLDPGEWELVDGDHSCKYYDYVMPPVITTIEDGFGMFRISILEWNTDTELYESVFGSNTGWTDPCDAIDEAMDRATESMEYVALDKFPYPCQFVQLPY